jgi:hypothetical protein
MVAFGALPLSALQARIISSHRIERAARPIGCARCDPCRNPNRLQAGVVGSAHLLPGRDQRAADEPGGGRHRVAVLEHLAEAADRLHGREHRQGRGRRGNCIAQAEDRVRLARTEA